MMSWRTVSGWVVVLFGRRVTAPRITRRRGLRQEPRERGPRRAPACERPDAAGPMSRMRLHDLRSDVSLIPAPAGGRGLFRLAPAAHLLWRRCNGSANFENKATASEGNSGGPVSSPH